MEAEEQGQVKETFCDREAVHLNNGEREVKKGGKGFSAT